MGSVGTSPTIIKSLGNYNSVVQKIGFSSLVLHDMQCPRRSCLPMFNSLKTPEFKPSFRENSTGYSLSEPDKSTVGDLLERVRAWAVALPTVLCLLGIFILALALLSYHPADAGWSTTGKTGGYYNWLGASGAWLADIVLYALGRSAWVVLVVAACWAVKALFIISQGRRTPAFAWVAVISLVLWLLVSCTLEAMRLNDTKVVLPFGAGGVIGYSIAKALAFLAPERFWVMGLTLAWLLLATFTFATSWPAVALALGTAWDAFRTKRAAKIDNQESIALGAQMQAARSAEVEQTLAQPDFHHPIEVRPVLATVIPKYEAPKALAKQAADEKIKAKLDELRAKQASARALQPVLFEEAPAEGY